MVNPAGLESSRARGFHIQLGRDSTSSANTDPIYSVLSISNLLRSTLFPLITFWWRGPLMTYQPHLSLADKREKRKKKYTLRVCSKGQGGPLLASTTSLLAGETQLLPSPDAAQHKIKTQDNKP